MPLKTRCAHAQVGGDIDCRPKDIDDNVPCRQHQVSDHHLAVYPQSTARYLAVNLPTKNSASTDVDAKIFTAEPARTHKMALDRLHGQSSHKYNRKTRGNTPPYMYIP